MCIFSISNNVLNFRALENWVTLSPAIKPVAAPSIMTMDIKGSVEHISMTKTSLYTNEELKSWDFLSKYSDYNQVITQKISAGTRL